MTTVVFVRILQHRRDDDKEQGRQHGGLTIGNRDYFDRLQNGNHSKVDICCLGKLLEQIHWDKCEPVILACRDLIVLDKQSLLGKLCAGQGEGPVLSGLAEAERLLETGKTRRDLSSDTHT